MTSSMAACKVIDSHLHVWANLKESSADYPYAVNPPENLQNKASTDALLKVMEKEGVDGALIVQPINHKYDHSYVRSALQNHPTRFKGMLLHDPTLDASKAVSRLEELSLQGFVGVRYNPYLWPKEGEGWSSMCNEGGMAVFRRCGELKMPVGIMCFQGLHLHYDDIVQFLQASPDTQVILDHFGFAAIDSDTTFQQLLSLAKYPAVHVKISALFRLKDESDGYQGVYEKRFVPLLAAFGKDRLMFGSDFPFCLEQPDEYRMHTIVKRWCSLEEESATIETAVLGGTAEKLFGKWG